MGKDNPTEGSGADRSPEKNRSRLLEITSILRRHEIFKGITPVRLREILEDLGPTYIKLGQIMSTRSDILPREYCDELMQLRSGVKPMPFDEVIRVIEDSYGRPWEDVFDHIDRQPLGSASIAQVHRAQLVTGGQVVVKVQREGIYDTMRRDISLMHKAVKLLPPVRLKGLLDLDMVLDELWVVAQEEMNFLTEAANMEKFHELNSDVEYVACPILYRSFTTEKVLVMEYIDGLEIDDKEALLAGGYDLHEIGTKLVDNFMKQVLEDGFFHADPHPGNLRIRAGKIVWIDMGMMGILSKKDRELFGQAVEGISVGDISQIQDAVLGIARFKGNVDKRKLYKDLGNFIDRYSALDFGDLDIAQIMAELMEIMKRNYMELPHGLTLLVRGLTQMEGVLTQISPEISIIEIASNRMRQAMFQTDNLKKTLKSGTMKAWIGLRNLIELPTLAGKILRGYEKDQTRVHLELHADTELRLLLHHLVRNLVIGMCIAALLVSSSIICTTDMWPKIFGIPLLGAVGFVLAVGASLFVLIRYFIHRKQKK